MMTLTKALSDLRAELDHSHPCSSQVTVQQDALQVLLKAYLSLIVAADYVEEYTLD